MIPYAIIVAIAVVTVALVIFGVWFANRLGQQSGNAELRAAIAKEETERAQKAAQVLADPRTDDDTAARLRDGGF